MASTITLARPWSKPPETGRARVLFYAVLLAGTTKSVFMPCQSFYALLQGSMVFWHWEAMIISYLAVRLPALPFRNMEELMSKTDKKSAETKSSLGAASKPAFQDHHFGRQRLSGLLPLLRRPPLAQGLGYANLVLRRIVPRPPTRPGWDAGSHNRRRGPRPIRQLLLSQGV